MPRKSKQTGPKANRTDLNTVGTQPVQVASGQAYGDAKALTEAQQAAPLPQSDPLAAALARLGEMPAPLPGVGMGGPSGFANEPVTAGLPIGPGPGPEILGVGPRRDVADTLMRLAGISGDPALLALAQRAAQEGV